MSATTYRLGQTSQRSHEKLQFPASPLLLELFLRRYYVTPQEVSAIDQGHENQSFLVTCRHQKYVLRIYRHGRKTTAQIEAELDFMDYLRDHDIPVPEVIRNARGEYVTRVMIRGVQWQAILMTHMPGRHSEVHSRRFLSRLASLQARMHQLGIAYSQSLEDEAAPAVATDESGLPRGHCHLDLTCFNLLVARDGQISAVLDFDDLAIRPVVDCLTTTLIRTLPLFKKPEDVAYYLAEYQKVRPLSRREQLRLSRKLILWGKVMPQVTNAASAGRKLRNAASDLTSRKG